MFSAFVGCGNQFPYKLILLLFPFFAQIYDPVPVVLLGLVVHLVVHSGLFRFQQPLRKTYCVDEFGHRQFGDFFQRVEDVHHQQVLAGHLVQVLHVGIALVSEVVAIGLLGFQLAAEAGQPAYKRGFD